MMAESGGVPIVLTKANLDELAASLGFSKIYPRPTKGRTYFYDDFGSGIHQWEVGAGMDVGWDGNQGERSGFSMRLSPTALIGARVDHFSPLYAARNPLAGCEVSVLLAAGLASFEITHACREGGLLIGANIVLSPGIPGLVQIATPGGNQVLATPPDLWIEQFHTVKLIVDFKTKRYVSLRVDDAVWSLTQFPLWLGASAAARYIVTGLLATPGAALDTYVGHVELTADEEI